MAKHNFMIERYQITLGDRKHSGATKSVLGAWWLASASSCV
jgi:hypothetical protein